MNVLIFSFIAWLVFGLMFRAAGFGPRSGWLFAALMAAGLGASAAFYLN
jgi:hypothetical protein